jgi:choline dehydrogenase-like flavoprotein
LTLSLANGGTFLTLNTTHRDPETFLQNLAAQSADAFLAPNLPKEVIAGYVAQKKALLKLYASIDATIYETPFTGPCSRTTIINKPLSRGNIHINPSNPSGPPVIDFRVFSNPLDIEYAVETLLFSRKYMNTPTLEPLKPVETGPGPNVTDFAALKAYIHATSGPTSFHVSGTAAMLPRDLGGVVDPELRVYGTKGLSIVDASIMPLIPSNHLSATVYAVAEKVCRVLTVTTDRFANFVGF